MNTRSLSLRAVVGVLVTVMLTALAPAANADATCQGEIYRGKLYCASTVSEVKATAHPLGARVALHGVSVTAKTATTLTVAALEETPCPPGYFCGASVTTASLTFTWTAYGRPAVGKVINLFGTTTPGSLTPVGYAIDPYGCYIDWC